MIKKHFIERIISNRLIAKQTYEMTITYASDAARLFRPGQFMHITVPDSNELLLRRPISINWVDKEKEEATIVYQVVGEGTKRLAKLQPETQLDIVTNLGKGFTITPSMKKIWLVGGGVGCAPLRSLFAKYPDRQYRAILGFKNRDYVYQTQEFEDYSRLQIATDDGSNGFHGFCTECLEAELKVDKPDVILACGPLPFFKSLAAVVQENIPTQVSLEERMGCGTGGCATCACSIEGEHKRVCMDGPAFDIREVDTIWT